MEATIPDLKFKVDDLNFYYGAVRALSSISIDIEELAITALIGPSGCGKSTFLRCLNRMNDPIPDTRIEGQVLLDGEDIDSRALFRKRWSSLLDRIVQTLGIRADEKWHGALSLARLTTNQDLFDETSSVHADICSVISGSGLTS